MVRRVALPATDCQNENMLKKFAAFAAIAFFLTGCSEGSTTITPSESAQVEELDIAEDGGEGKASEVEESEPSERTAEEESDPSASSESDLGSRDQPIPQGQVVSLDDGLNGVWEITVGPSLLNANALVAEENMFNDAPPEGFQYALLPVKATYLGDETGDPGWDLDFAFVSSSGTTHKEFDISVVAPNDLSNSNELYKGGSAEGNIVIAVPSEDIESGTWRVETSWGDQVVFFRAQ